MTLSLLADIGGTNSRFAICDRGAVAPRGAKRYRNRDFASLELAIAEYLAETGVGAEVSEACLAIAGPVVGDLIRLTNIDWEFSCAALQAHFGWERLRVVNDFTALAMAVPILPESYVKKLYGGEALADSPISVLGPGTGLGVGGLLPTGQGWVALQGEGGHTGFCPGNVVEAELLKFALTQQERVDNEHLISGSGLPFLHRCLQAVHGEDEELLKAEEITWRATSGEHADAARTVNVFCGLLGAFAGDQALLLGAHGGVYLGGGILPQLTGFLESSPFRERFLAKGRFRPYVEEIPIHLLLSYADTALLGAAAILSNK